MLGRLIAAVSAMAVLAGPAVAQEVLPARPIPDDAVVIFASFRAGDHDQWGLPADSLYVANWKGEATRITYSKFAHNHFSPAPNRRYIAANRYSRGDNNKDGKYFPYDDWKELWLIDTQTGEERRLAPDYDAGWGGLAWSPDSKWIYFSGPASTNVMEVKRVNIDTGEVQVLTANLNQLLGYPDDVKAKSVTDVDVSDDGEWLIYNYRGPEMMVDGMRGGKPKARIGVMKIDGSQAHLVSDGGPLPAGRRGVWPVGDFDADMSPDGKQIVYARMTDKGWISEGLSTWDLWVVRVGGAGAYDLSGEDNMTAQVIPSWGLGANGDQLIAYTQATMEDPRRVPWVLNLRTGERTRMAEEGRHVQLLAPPKK